jgi:3-oxoacyl-[acyl-carrier protein] reductase
MFDFDGQHVLVTGGTRGIGASAVRAFLRAGASVTATYCRNEERASAFLKEFDGALRSRLTLTRFDISDRAAVERFFESLEQHGGSLQVLVNNAGLRVDGVVALMDQAAWQRVLDVNLTGTFNMCKRALGLMLPERYGRIVTITSPAGRIGSRGQANYAASKAGLVAFSKSLAREVATRGVTVNCVSPGIIETDFISDLPQEQKRELVSMVPMQRFGSPEEVAACILFLASRRASYVTGAVLEATGGA